MSPRVDRPVRGDTVKVRLAAVPFSDYAPVKKYLRYLKNLTVRSEKDIYTFDCT